MGLTGPAVNLKQMTFKKLATHSKTTFCKYEKKTSSPVLNLEVRFSDFTFKFMLQRRVIKLYRDLFRATNGVSDEQSRKEIRDWIRTDFKKHKSETDEYAIKMLILHGERALRELQTNISLSK